MSISNELTENKILLSTLRVLSASSDDIRLKVVQRLSLNILTIVSNKKRSVNKKPVSITDLRSKSIVFFCAKSITKPSFHIK